MRTLKITAISIATVLAIALVALARGVPANLITGQLQSRVEAETGYRLRITGNSTLALWPSPALTIRGVSVDSPKAPDQANRLTAESIRLSFALSGLFPADIRINEIAFGHPVLRIPLLRERPGRAASAKGQPGSLSPAPAMAVPIGRLTVDDGTILLSSGSNEIESRIEGVAATASFSGQDGPPSLRAEGRWGEQSLRLEAIAEGPVDSWTGQTIPLKLTFEAPGLFQDPLAGKTGVNLAGTTLTLSGLKGTIGASAFSGWVSADFDSKLAVRAELGFDRLSLGLPLDHAEDGSGPGTGGAGAPPDWNRPWSDRKINIEAFNYFDADVHLRAAGLRAGKFRFQPLPIHAILADGVLKASFQDVGLYGGQAGGNLFADSSGAVPNYALQLNLSGLRALPLLNDFAGFDALDGQVEAKIDLSAKGASLRAIMPSLSGSADISITNGEIRHINIAKLIRALAANPLTGWQESTADRTRLSRLSALFRIRGGQASTGNFHLAGPMVRVTGKGSADIAAKTLSFKLDPELLMGQDGKDEPRDRIGFGVPVIVEGSWAKPRVYPDVAGILDDPAAAYAKLRALGKGLFGSNAELGAGLDALTQGLGKRSLQRSDTKRPDR
ncbi:MAG: AsmA family protein, partial [Beijerinckiaceae bacterium]|nr:AsmA family protein [Beijerinckiaceae bacterium]